MNWHLNWKNVFVCSFFKDFEVNSNQIITLEIIFCDILLQFLFHSLWIIWF